MGLRETYRSQLIAKQNRSLLLYLGLAIAVHAGAATGVAVWRPFNLSQPVPTPIEFVDLEPNSAQPIPPPTPIDRQAVVNSKAGGKSSQLSPQAIALSSPPAQSLTLNPELNDPKPRPLSVPSPFQSPPTPQTSLPSAAVTPQGIASASPKPVPSIPTPSQLADSTYSVSIQTQPTQNLTSPSTNLSIRPTANQPNNQLTDQQANSHPQSFDRNAAEVGADAVQNPQWGTYLSGLNRTIDRQWQRVSVAATRRTQLRFRIDRQGKLSNLQVLQSSGDTLADQAAIQAVRAAAPFAPLPQAASEEALIVNFTFTQWLPPASP